MRRLPRWAAMQAVAALAAFILLAVRPPAEGFLLLVPMTGAAARLLPTVAVAGGATLIARGPWPGSLVIHGVRRRIAKTPGLLVLAAPESLCGAGQ